MFLDQDANETLERSQTGAVQHHGAVLFAIWADVIGIQPLGQDEIDLMGAALPFAPDGVGQGKLQLGAVKSAFAGVQHRLDPGGAGGGQKGGLGLVPNLVTAGALFGAGGEQNFERGKAQIAVDVRQ